jgi:signal recognition particle receptor subunit beta
MALLDPESGTVVVRVIYDGPSESGKTTSLAALAAQLPQHRCGKFHSLNNRAGNTLYFDLLELDGGTIEGYQLRCQIVTVPGAPALTGRRFVLLSLADTVIFVVGRSQPELNAGVREFATLRPFLKPLREPPVGLVLQANQRDDKEALSLAEISRSLGREIPTIETMASQGKGIRKAFILAVRQGVARARRLIATDAIPIGRLEPDCGTSLVDLMDELAPFPGINLEGKDTQGIPALGVFQPNKSRSKKPGHSQTEKEDELDTQTISADRARVLRAMPY